MRANLSWRAARSASLWSEVRRGEGSAEPGRAQRQAEGGGEQVAVFGGDVPGSAGERIQLLDRQVQAHGEGALYARYARGAAGEQEAVHLEVGDAELVPAIQQGGFERPGEDGDAARHGAVELAFELSRSGQLLLVQKAGALALYLLGLGEGDAERLGDERGYARAAARHVAGEEEARAAHEDQVHVLRAYVGYNHRLGRVLPPRGEPGVVQAEAGRGEGHRGQAGLGAYGGQFGELLLLGDGQGDVARAAGGGDIEREVVEGERAAHRLGFGLEGHERLEPPR